VLMVASYLVNPFCSVAPEQWLETGWLWHTTLGYSLICKTVNTQTK